MFSVTSTESPSVSVAMDVHSATLDTQLAVVDTLETNAMLILVDKAECSVSIWIRHACSIIQLFMSFFIQYVGHALGQNIDQMNLQI